MITIDQTIKLYKTTLDTAQDIYLDLIEDGNKIGQYSLQQITKITANAHVHINKEYQNKGYSKKVFLPFLDWVVDHTSYRNLLATIPVENYQMLKIMSGLPYEVTGKIKNGIIYNNKAQDLILFQYEIKR